eukprot:CAMPEP_0198145054 /NCGR_PEP_ID=MMETSP1443-20131203/20733_1 /TAXON_ID=186043 /ORGANISM="Entomoneis sp., Strain CCMP2396" /LENGTH=392 /DNA_ID=CAMNT_0043808573 /DNA_START=42 /DNA_END=1216 /DNA_ORIENTATION=+
MNQTLLMFVSIILPLVQGWAPKLCFYQRIISAGTVSTGTTTTPSHRLSRDHRMPKMLYAEDTDSGAEVSASSSALLPTSNDSGRDNSISTATTTFSPLFNFEIAETAAKFGRIDDVIMGGVSSSTFADAPDTEYAKWSGICRTDGGGFCGVRTLAFEDALTVGDSDGLYFVCKLASDDEPERRVWKVTTRVKPDRGEQLYQARYYFTPPDENGWSTVRIPFDSFQLVRGPRTVPNSPPLNVTGGIYQIGMTMSKFELGENVTELENFKAGFFEYHLKAIGLYKEGVKDDDLSLTSSPKVLSAEESKKKTSPMLKVIRPVSKLIFTEQGQRRKAAMRLLTEKRGLSRIGAILYGLRSRASSRGWLAAWTRLMAMVTVDTSRAGVFLPVRLVFA